MAGPRLPIFPLHAVLFPGMPMPLHVFEERYQEMMRRCLAEDERFGVCLIKRGAEVGGPAEPHEVGTVAQITGVERLEGGRLKLLVEGRERFRVSRVVSRDPYLVSEIEAAPEMLASGATALRLAEIVSARFSAFIQEFLVSTGRGSARMTLPVEPVGLSHAIAARLPIDVMEKQALLATDDVVERLTVELGLLRRESRLLQAVGPGSPEGRPEQGPPRSSAAFSTN